MPASKAQKRQERHTELRREIWPDVDDKMLWSKTTAKGFTNVPRTMPLILSIMDDMANSRPVSSVYFELWCRTFEEFVVSLSNTVELSFHSGFSGQRAQRTWRERIKKLEEIGFIRVAPGPGGDLGYALILNPYHVIKNAYESRSHGVRKDKYFALLTRMAEIGAEDLTESVSESEAPRIRKKKRKLKSAV